jgi:2-polyprenyl-6-hydroxyphenyl methylase / 3-demethylubiquinone-9 3-methyltransferase
MKTDKTSKTIDNEVYEERAPRWWDDDEPIFSTLRFFVNPVRFRYFAFIVDHVLRLDHRSARLLDVGCGGGFLSEDFARTGIAVTGIDPSPATIEAAKTHALGEGLTIDYRVAPGESLPFPDASFSLVACCDVLEHVEDPDRVINEIARVLAPGGVFFYDTINRTFLSRIVTIKIMQEWKSTAFATEGAHDWDKFIKPRELEAMMERRGLTNREMRGIIPGADPITCYLNMVRAKKGKITYRELGRRLAFRLGNGTANSYVGYAIKEYRS